MCKEYSRVFGRLAAVNILVVPQPEAGTLSLMFGWSQFITAVVGGLVV